MNVQCAKIRLKYRSSLLKKGLLLTGNNKAWLGTNTIKEFSFSDHIHTGYALSDHIHSQYVTGSYLQEQINIINQNIADLSDTIQGSNGVSFTALWNTITTNIMGQTTLDTTPKSLSSLGIDFTPSRIKICAGSGFALLITASKESWGSTQTATEFISYSTDSEYILTTGGVCNIVTSGTINGGYTYNGSGFSVHLTDNTLYVYFVNANTVQSTGSPYILLSCIAYS